MLPSTRTLEIFCAVVETGNFTQAAQRLALTPTAVSRAIARHEQELGVKLFQRTTRSMSLTDTGRGYYERCHAALRQLEAAAALATAGRGVARGHVRLSAPTTYGHHRLLPALPAFLAEHPEVSVEVDLSNRNVDLVGERYDLAVRMGYLPDSTLVVRKLEDASIGVFASPRYLERHGAPAHPDQLVEHVCIAFVRPSSGRALPWLFLGPDGAPLDRQPPERVRCSSDPLACVALAREGAGLVQAYRFVVEHDLRRGQLVELLEPYAGRTGPFSLLQPAKEGRTLAAQRLAEHLVGLV